MNTRMGVRARFCVAGLTISRRLSKDQTIVGTHLTGIAADLLRVDKRGPDPPQLNLDGIATDKISEQFVLKLCAIGGGVAVLRVEVARQELRVEPVAWYGAVYT